jgi:uncharacterized damage-inducible protein DinB
MYLIENLPGELWAKSLPGSPRRSIRSIAAHLHNTRCSWTRAIGHRHGIKVPRRVDSRAIKQRQLLRALVRSSVGIADMLRLAMKRGGAIPPAAWQNFPTDAIHFLCYFVAHEAHHRGQLCLLARQLGHPLSAEVSAGLWQWKQRSRE